MYIKLYKQISAISNKSKSLSNQNLFNFFFYKLSNLIAPVFIILGFSSNSVTIINFFIGLSSCYLVMLNSNYLVQGIIIFFIFRILDNVDGGIARYQKKTFYGKFLDATSDAIIYTLFFVSLAFYFFNFSENKNLLIFGIISSFIFFLEILILDKFGSLVRWCNEQNSKKFSPYIRRTYGYRINLIIRDLIFLSLAFFIFENENSLLFKLTYIGMYSCIFLSGILNVSLHLFFAKKYLNFRKK
ncbi:CDP-alcohol phosphatidyltransferase family protein [Candidatus Pelagibacter sp.]|nr:CDP-alcohol phosphatidyltransferase family protein [Candidatus Pelagibacter sp.]